MGLPAQPVQLNVYPVKSLLHLFLWGELLGVARLFNRDEIVVALISTGCLGGFKNRSCEVEKVRRWEDGRIKA